jgi:hypothetical protein
VALLALKMRELHWFISISPINTPIRSWGRSTFSKSRDPNAGASLIFSIVFGGEQRSTTGTYYPDEKNGMMVGYVSDTDEADYFGYVKKLVLTLHNLG